MSDKPGDKVRAVPVPPGLEPSHVKPPVEDVTQQVPPMRMHEHMNLVALDVLPFKMTSEELLFMLSLLNDVHANLIRDVKNEKLNAAARKEAYEMALNTEKLYSSICKQLKLYGPDRKDAH